MRNLKDFINESLLDDFDKLDNDVSKNYILDALLSKDKKQHEDIIEFIKTSKSKILI